MPYPSKFFMQMHPDRLAVIGRFFGMSPATMETCRVLELGCGNGSNLIAHAFTMPDAKFVGIDLAENHIADAKRDAAALGLKNVEFHQMDVADIKRDDFGGFDFITAHGLFSWIPDFVRPRVIEIFGQMLNPNGIGYISYVTLPGGHQRQMVQEMLRHHVRDVADPLEKINKAMSFLRFLAANSTERLFLAPFLKKEVERHAGHDAADIFHDDLSDMNHAFSLTEFSEMLGASGLKFLGEAELHSMGTRDLSDEARAFIDSMDDIVEREQNLDFIRGRVFRQTLFCRNEISLNHSPSPEIIGEFKFVSSVSPAVSDPDIDGPTRVKFFGAHGANIEIEHPLTKAMLVILGQEWGRAIAFDDLVAMAVDRFGVGASKDDIQMASAIIFQICRETDILELHLFQPNADAVLGEYPKITALIAHQLKQGRNVMSSLNLDVRIDDVVSRHLLTLCDGTRPVAEIASEIRRFARTSREIEDKSSLPTDLFAWVKGSLNQLAKLGVFG
jgi:SAM-dependent methyltransferase